MKVTEEDAQKFSGYVTTWQEILSLGDWRINVSPKRSNRKVMGEVFKIDLEQRNASIRLGKDFGVMDVDDKTLRELALHEVLHVFLHELIETVKIPDVSDDTARSAEHRVINVLEKLLADYGAK